MPIEKINGWTNFATMVATIIVTVVVVGFGTGVIYSKAQSSITTMQGRVAESRAKTAGLTATVNTIKTEQAVIKTKIDAEERRATDFRRRTDKTLDRILQKLDK